MRFLFRLWFVWAVFWVAVIGLGGGFNNDDLDGIMKFLALIVGGPAAVVLALRWVFKPRAAGH